VLETQGVAVAALGADEFPAFFTRRSGCTAPLRVADAAEAAALVYASAALGLGSGILLGVPIPAEAEAEASAVQVFKAWEIEGPNGRRARDRC